MANQSEEREGIGLSWEPLSSPEMALPAKFHVLLV